MTTEEAASAAVESDRPTRPLDPGEIQLLQKQLARVRKERDRERDKNKILVDAVNLAYRPGAKLTLPKYKAPAAKGRDETIAFAHLSDLQVGSKTPSYSTAIAGERVREYARKVVEITEERRHAEVIRKLVVLWGGDISDHESKRPDHYAGIDCPLFDQACVWAPRFLAEAAIFWARHFEEIEIVSVIGNHGMVYGEAAHPRTNWDAVACEFARVLIHGSDHYPNDALRKVVKFGGEPPRLIDEVDQHGLPEPDRMTGWYVVLPMWDWRVLGVHGHQIRGGFGGFPFYGTAKAVWGWCDSIDEPIDYVAFGHYHQLGGMPLNGRRWLSNGTTETGNEWVLQSLKSAGTASQRLSFFNRKHGLKADYEVFLSDDRVPQIVRARRWAERYA